MPNTERIEKERSKAIEMAVGQIEKQFGKGSIMRLGGKGSISAIESIPTGSISIDYALGVGGVPRGRVIEIYGPEASGKTTLALQVIANAQAAGGNAAFVDAEHALDPVYSTKLGVDLDNLLVSQPDHGEQALEIVETLPGRQAGGGTTDRRPWCEKADGRRNRGLGHRGPDTLEPGRSDYQGVVER